MSNASHVRGDPLESLAARIARAVLTVPSSQGLSSVVEVGIRTERVFRRAVELELACVAALVRVTTKSERRRRRERADARAQRPGLDSAVPEPVVHWHEGGDGPALLLLNGWTASGLLWPSGFVRRLEETYRVIRIDNRGTGWSRTAPAPFTMADLADDARSVLDACGVDQAVVLGFSMGGMIAQEMALRHPSRVSRMILVATRPPSPSQVVGDPSPFVAALVTPATGQELHDYFAGLWGTLAGGDFAGANAGLLDELVDQILHRVTPRQRVIDQIRAIAAWRNAVRLETLDVPATVVHGTRDALMPVGNGMRLARMIPGAQYIELRDVGHLVPHEAGDKLVEVVGAPRTAKSTP